MIELKFVATTLFNIAINVVSSIIYDNKISLLKKIKFNKFKKGLNTFINDFINKNDETILTTSDFCFYFENYNVVETAINTILGININILGMDEYLDDMVTKLKSSHEVTPSDESVAKEFLKGIFQQVEYFMCSQLSDKERYSLSKTRSEIKDLSKQIEDGTQKIADLINDKDKIKDTGIISSIFKILENDLLNGDLVKIKNILPLIENKNEDLENGIKITLQLLSNFNVISGDVITIYSTIQNLDISNEVARLLLLTYFNEKEKLIQLKEKCRNEQLCNIIYCVITNKKDSFYQIVKERKEHLTYFNIIINKNFFNENWLISRIVMCYLVKEQSLLINEQLLADLLKDRVTFLDQLLFYSFREISMMRNITDDNLSNLTDVEQFKKELDENAFKFENVATKFKTKFYEVRCCIEQRLFLSSKEFISVEIPDILSDNIRVQTYLTLNKTLHKDIEFDEILKFVIKTEQYWLLNTYFITNKVSIESIIEILQSNKLLIKNDAILFFIYVQALRITGKVELWKQTMTENSSTYNMLLEFWLEKYSLDNSDENLNSILSLWENDEIDIITPKTLLQFAELTLSKEKYEISDSAITCYETLLGEDVFSIRIKGEILRLQNKELEALELYTKNFEKYENDPFVVERIMMLSRNNLREIPQKVIDCAIKSNNALLLMHCASEYKKSGDDYKAKMYSIQALLNSSSADEMCGYYIGIHTNIHSATSPTMEYADVDTAVYLSNENADKHIIYCIYKEKILPTCPMHWEDATHIYEDDAIHLGLMRKKCDEKITIDDIEYHITDILSLECHLYILCMKKLVEGGKAKAFSVETNENGIANIEDFKAWIIENTGNDEPIKELINSYQDLNSTPMPIYLMHQVTRLTYTEMSLSILQNEQIIVRELLFNNKPTYDASYGFVLSFSAIIALYLLCVDVINAKDFIIPQSCYRQICDDADDIIRTNKSEHAAVLGTFQNDIFVHESSQEEKQEQMNFAVTIKRFAQSFTQINNTDDLNIPEYDNTNLKQVIGICDYDALTLASSTNKILVSAEVCIEATSLIENANIKAECILDFLCDIGVPAIKLLEIMKKMVKFKFMNVLSVNCYKYLLDSYTNGDVDIKQQILYYWDAFLNSVSKEDNDYYNLFRQIVTQVYLDIYSNEELNINNGLFGILFRNCLRLNNLNIKIGFNESGQPIIIKHYQPQTENN